MQRTDTPQLTTPAPQTPPQAASPFGPVRKREKPPVGIPGQRKPADTLPPRPAPPTSVFAPDPKKTATWWDHAEQFLGETYDRYDNHASRDAFGAA